MSRLQEAVGLGLVLGALHGAAHAVPVVPNFTQGSMTSHTETTQKITETNSVANEADSAASQADSAASQADDAS